MVGKNGDIFIPTIKETTQKMMLRLTGKDINCCPVCAKGLMIKVIGIEPEYHTYLVPGRKKEVCNTS